MPSWNLAKFAEVAANVMTTPQSRTPVQLLRKTVFKDAGVNIAAIEQNVNTGSYWASLAKAGRQVVQFRPESGGPYIGVAVDGKVTLYNGQAATTPTDGK